MTPDRDLLTNYRPSTHSCTFGNGKREQAKGVGEVVLMVDSATGPVSMVLKEVLHIPSLPYSLFSTSKLKEGGGSFMDSSKHGSQLQMPDDNIVPLTVDDETGLTLLAAESLGTCSI